MIIGNIVKGDLYITMINNIETPWLYSHMYTYRLDFTLHTATDRQCIPYVCMYVCMYVYTNDIKLPGGVYLKSEIYSSHTLCCSQKRDDFRYTSWSGPTPESCAAAGASRLLRSSVLGPCTVLDNFNARMILSVMFGSPGISKARYNLKSPSHWMKSWEFFRYVCMVYIAIIYRQK